MRRILSPMARFAVPISSVSGKAPRLKTRPLELQSAEGRGTGAFHRTIRRQLDPERYWQLRGNKAHWDAWLKARAREVDALPEHLREALAPWLDCCAAFATFMSKS